MKLLKIKISPLPSFLTPWIVTEDLELNCEIFPFFISLLLLWLVNGTKWFNLSVRAPVILDHKIMTGFLERHSVLGASD